MMMMSNGDTGVQEQAPKTQEGLATKVGKSFEDMIAKFKPLELGNSVKTAVDEASKFQEKMIVNARSMGQTAAYAKGIENSLADAGVNALLMGGKMEDVLATFEKVTSELEKTTFLSTNFLSNAQAIKKFGVGEESVTKIAVFFDKVGGGMEQAMDRTIQLVNTAQKYGLNAGKFVTDVAAKMDLLNKYGFPKGVDDLSKMVVRSKELGETLSVAQNMADQIMDSPEKAYEMAAQLQTLGGSFSQLGDGAQLLYMAQNDLQGLQEQIIKATRGIATFNETTGQFQISTNERLRLRQLKNLGMDVDKVEEAALKLAKQEKIIKEMQFAPEFKGVSEENMRILSSYAQIEKGGKITIEGKDIKDNNQLNSAKITEILSRISTGEGILSTDSTKNVETIQNNLSANEQMTLATNKLNNAFTIGILSLNGFSSTLDKAAEVGKVYTEVAAAQIVRFSSNDGRGDLKTEIDKIFTEAKRNAERAITAANLQKSQVNVARQSVRVAGTIDIKGVDAKLAELIKANLSEYINREVARHMRPHPHEGGTP